MRDEVDLTETNQAQATDAHTLDFADSTPILRTAWSLVLEIDTAS